MLLSHSSPFFHIAPHTRPIVNVSCAYSESTLYLFYTIPWFSIALDTYIGNKSIAAKGCSWNSSFVSWHLQLIWGFSNTMKYCLLPLYFWPGWKITFTIVLLFSPPSLKMADFIIFQHYSWNKICVPPLSSWGVASRTCHPLYEGPKSLRENQLSFQTWKFLHARVNKVSYYYVFLNCCLYPLIIPIS